MGMRLGSKNETNNIGKSFQESKQLGLVRPALEHDGHRQRAS